MVVEKTCGELALHRAAEQVPQVYADTDADYAKKLTDNATAPLDVNVSFHGTWHKRGFTSLCGVGSRYRRSIWSCSGLRRTIKILPCL